jgi:gluconolactonase
MTQPDLESIVATGLQSPEAPLLLGDGTWLVVEMTEERGCLTHVGIAGALSTVCRTGRPNGLALSQDGSVIVAESLLQALLLLGSDWRDRGGDWRVVVDRDETGGPLLFPNDLCFGPDGALYVTDSGLPLEEMQRSLLSSEDPASLPFDGRLYRVDPTSWEVETIEAGLGHLNGISVGTDGALYTNDTISGDVYRYPFGVGGIGARDTFGNVIDRTLAPAFRGPDGMAHDIDGNLYVTVFNQSEVVVLGPDGEWVDRIRTRGSQPTNVAFGRNEAAIYVTERESGTLQRLPALAVGAPLHPDNPALHPPDPPAQN